MPERNRSPAARPTRRQPHLPPALHRRWRRRRRGGWPRPVLPGRLQLGRRVGGRQRRRRRTGPASGTLRISNWPLYMADGFVAAFQTATGHHRRLQGGPQRQRAVVRQGQGAAVSASRTSAPTSPCRPRSWPSGCSSSVGSTRSAMPASRTRRTCAPDLLEASVDPGRKFSAPYMSGFVGIGYNRAATGRDIKTHRRPVGSRVQGPGQPVLRHPGRARA